MSAPVNAQWRTAACEAGALDDALDAALDDDGTVVSSRQSSARTRAHAVGGDTRAATEETAAPRQSSRLMRCLQLLLSEKRKQQRLVLAAASCPTSAKRPLSSLGDVPPYWFFCELAQLIDRPRGGGGGGGGSGGRGGGGRGVGSGGGGGGGGGTVRAGKLSPGVLALVPGASLLFGLLDPATPLLVQPLPGRMRVRLRYLTSYELMGRARLRCVGACSCFGGLSHVLDAHRPFDARAATQGSNQARVSIFETFEFVVSLHRQPPLRRAHGSQRTGGAGGTAAVQCSLLAMVERNTSSAGHKFKFARFSNSQLT